MHVTGHPGRHPPCRDSPRIEKCSVDSRARGVHVLPDAGRVHSRKVARLTRRARPLWTGLRVDELAAEAITELFGMLALRKAEHEHIGVVAAERVRART
jgi:hypothetical protein